MPTSTSLLMAASLLWVLDASINISMEPFRAFVADKLDVAQRTSGFVMQSLMIGIGASLANALPYVLGKFGVAGEHRERHPAVGQVRVPGRRGGVPPRRALDRCSPRASTRPRTWPRSSGRSARPGGVAHLFAEVGEAIRDMPRR
jgi:maltose/moltooligosaccharide transporter